jgi:hypothetical protein
MGVLALELGIAIGTGLAAWIVASPRRRAAAGALGVVLTVLGGVWYIAAETDTAWWIGSALGFPLLLAIVSRGRRGGYASVDLSGGASDAPGDGGGGGS